MALASTMSDDLDTDLVQRAPPRRVAPIFAVLFLLAAAGAGVWAWQEREGRLASERKLAAQADEQKSLTDALDLLRTSSSDVSGQLTSCKQELTTQNTGEDVADEKRQATETALAACQASVKDLESQRQTQATLLAERKGMSARFAQLVAKGKLDVSFRRGKMVLKLPAQVLFATGASQLSPEGKEALGQVAAVLRTLPGRRFTVAGHTDNVGDKSVNWELSAARAVQVTELLVAAGIPGSRLAAAGYGEYDPVTSNASPRGRQKNRRIEIILEPELGAPPAAAGKPKPAPPVRKRSGR